MVALQPLVSEFNIVGRLEDVVVNSKGCVKYLYLSTPEADYSMVVVKEQKNVLNKYLKPGCHLKVTGMRKYKLHQEKIEYKVYRIELLPQQAITNTISTNAKPKAKVLICQSSTCWQKGGKAAYETLQTELQAKGITNEVEIITTGCLKQCKQAPNLVIMPGKNRYSRVQPKQLSQLIVKYLL